MVEVDLKDSPRVTPKADQLPPHDEQLERAVLGCMLRNEGCMSEPIAAKLSEKSFYLLTHKAIFRIVKALADASKPTDVVTVCVALRDSGRIQDAGGMAYVSELPDKVPTTTLFNFYVPQLLDFQQRREAKAAAARLSHLVDTDFAAAVAHIESIQDVFRVSSKVEISERPMQSLILSAISRYEHAAENRGKLGVMTGFDEFDRRTGGLKPGTMTVVAAETNGGKSSFALNIANNAAINGSGVMVQSIEMSADELTDVLLAMNAKVSRNCFNTGDFTTGETTRLVSHIERLKRLPIHIRDAASPTIDDIDANASELAAAGKLKLVLIDYAQIVEARNAKDTREQQVAQIARGIKAMLKRLNVAGVVLSQLNDDGKLRESRVIAHEAHNVILLETEGSTMKCKIVKGRSIPRFDFTLNFEPEFCRLTSPSPINRNDYEN